MSSPDSRWRRPGWIKSTGFMIAPAIAMSGVMIAGASPPAVAAAEVPDVAQLAGPLAEQKIAWEKCDFGDPEWNEQLDQPNLQCATIKVPQDWKNPDPTKTFDIRISQAKNIEVDNPRYKGTMFGNPGGPGSTGLAMAPMLQMFTPDLNPYYNYVGFDPRGVGEPDGGQSTAVNCEFTWTPSEDPGARAKAIGEQCSNDPVIRTISTEQTAYDMDFIRSLLGAPKLDYLGYSYGTWLGSWYSKVFGAKYGGKFVLDSALDATQPSLEEAWNLQAKARDRQFEMHLMNWIARNDEQFGLGTNAREIYNGYLESSEAIGEPFIIQMAWAITGGIYAFGNNAQYPQAGLAVLLVTRLGEFAVQEGAASEQDNPAARLDELLDRVETPKNQAEVVSAREKLAPFLKLAVQQSEPGAEITESLQMPVFTMVLCNDGQWTQGSRYWIDRNTKDAQKYPLTAQFGFLDEVSECAYWRTNTTMPVADEATYPQTVVVQSELDSQTGWEGGYVSGTALPNTSFIAVDNEGSHGVFPYSTEAVDRPIIDFYLRGKQPADITVTQAKPLPLETQTFETWGKLNDEAVHEPVNPDPWTPAEAPRAKGPQKMSAAAAAAVSKIRAEAGSDGALVRQQIAKIYGPEGLEAMKEAGMR